MEHTTHIREEQLTTSVCLMIQTISATNLEFKGTTMCMEQSINLIKDHSKLLMTTMSPVLCYASTRVVVTMIPAKTSCPSTWTLEYSGYLMSGTRLHSGRQCTMYECIDKDSDLVPGSASNTNGAVLYHVEASCNGMLCPRTL